MGQSLGTRIEVLGTLVCLGPVHVGGWDNTAEANLTIARDGTGRPCLPGTSLAGALRAYLAGVDRFRGDGQAALMDQLFGHITPRGHGGSPSWIRVDDAPLVGDDVTPLVRDGVGIDRHSGSAAAAFLYTRQVLPAETRFALRLVADTPTDVAAPDYPGGWPALIEDAMRDMLAGLRQGRVPIGAGRGRGFGRVELGDVTVRRADLSSPAGLIAWLTGTAPADQHPASDDTPVQDGRLRVTVAWRPVSPLLVRDSISGTVVDTLPLTDTAADGTVRLLLPGSSIRGAIRAYAERIVRTLLGWRNPADAGDHLSFADALKQPPPGVDVLFGFAPAGAHGQSDAGAGPAPDGTGWRGVLTVADCHSSKSTSAQLWNTITTLSPGPVTDNGSQNQDERNKREIRNSERDRTRSTLRSQLDKLREDSHLALGVSDHVAIDRWTGGASDHRLFSVLDPALNTAWEPIRFEVDVVRLAEYPHRADAAYTALPLLLLVLRDLRDGWLSLGYGGTRGRGQIEVTEVTFDGDGLTGPWRSLAGRTLDAVLTDPPQEVVDAMAHWEQLIQEAAA